MTSEHLPEFLEIEYSFSVGGHNSLKLMDGRLFFFSEADSHLTEKNEYLTLVTVPESSTLKVFWDDLDQLRIWDWEEIYGEIEETSHGESVHNEEHNHCNHDHHEIINPHEEITGGNMVEITQDGDIWQVKIINGPQRVSCKSWSSGPESKDEFFSAVKKLVGIDICLPFADLSRKLSKE